jgi:hypothetical protein
VVKTVAVAVAALLVILVNGATPVVAASPGFCRDYARNAIRQTETGYSVPRCRRGMQPPRWTTDFRIHYDWCIGASYRAADAEREIRHRYLEHCLYY